MLTRILYYFITGQILSNSEGNNLIMSGLEHSRVLYNVLILSMPLNTFTWLLIKN